MLDVYIDNGIPASKRMPDVQILDDFLGVLYPYLEGIEQKYHLGIDIYGTFLRHFSPRSESGNFPIQ